MKIRNNLCAIFACVLLCGCSGGYSISLQPTIEEANTGLANIVRAKDLAASSQLINGIGPIENGNWRWTEPRFSVLLGVPPRARKTGGSLVLDFNVPEVSIKTLKTIGLSARIGNQPLESKTYKDAGAQSYRCQIAPSSLSADEVEINFVVDKSLALDGDRRQLGVIFKSAALEPI